MNFIADLLWLSHKKRLEKHKSSFVTPHFQKKHLHKDKTHDCHVCNFKKASGAKKMMTEKRRLLLTNDWFKKNRNQQVDFTFMHNL